MSEIKQIYKLKCIYTYFATQNNYNGHIKRFISCYTACFITTVDLQQLKYEMTPLLLAITKGVKLNN